MSKSVPARVPFDKGLLEYFDIPAALHDLLDFIGAEFVHKDEFVPMFLANKSLVERRQATRLDHWRLVLPCQVPGQRVEIPLPEVIDSSDPEGHWRAIIAAAADFQALVNTGEYTQG